MGFGILFIGYFLLLNIGYYELTDAIAAAVMLYAFYKLKDINGGFKGGIAPASVFAAFGLLELALFSLPFFGIDLSISWLETLIPMLRHGIVCVTSILMLTGMKEVATEVELDALSKRCARNIYITIAVFAITILLEGGFFVSASNPKLGAAIYLIAIIARLVILVLNLIAIYSCHMRICMPGQDDDKVKESRFGFVNDFRRHQEDKQREYAEYKLEKFKSKKNKKRKK